MGRILLQGFLIVGVALLSAALYQWRDMVQTTAKAVALLQQPTETPPTPPSRELLESLPPVVLAYLKTALPSLQQQPDDDTSTALSLNYIHFVQWNQKGTFRMGKDETTWAPFTAVQYASALPTNLGFVWDATIWVPEPLPGLELPETMSMPIRVQDAYSQGKGLLQAKFLGIVPLVHWENVTELNAGELIRHVAESFVTPTLLLPSSTIQWSPSSDQDPTKARLTVQDVSSKQANNKKVTLTVQFDEETKLPISILALRPKAVVAKSSSPGGEGGFSYNRWQGNFTEYSDIQGMKIPTRMQVGWWEQKILKLYFKAENYNFHYQFVA